LTATPTTPEPSLRDGGLGSSAVVGATATLLPPTPEGSGVKPGQVQQYFVRDAGPSAPAELRPPPYEVPLSIHPDDHYWLQRPLPSNRRTYDLEWYPFGNDVQVPELRPYRIHHGIDFPNPTGTTIVAAASGTVIHAGPLPSPRNGVNYYGNTVVIQHDFQWQGRDVFTLYAHTLELFVQEGDHVEQGQLIAGVGQSGEVTDSHLHFEVRVGTNNYNDARNPALWLAPYEGYGTLAGRLVDKRGQLIPDASIVVEPVNVQTEVRKQQTYSLVVKSDPVWRENFVVGDLPAGDYLLLVTVVGGNDSVAYRREVTIKPGQTNFEVIATQFEFVPTATPPPTPTIEATTAVITATLPISPTLEGND
ncbi:MAG: peptidoglycan DD-metalloendopeptidase family protein, partial [Anaerolineae bacterium]